MMTDDARAALKRLSEERREDYASLSRMIGRNPAYIQQFVKRGVPRRLMEEDRRILARYFGVDEEVLGGPGTSPRKQAIKVPEASRPSRFTPIRRLEVGASAGPGAEADDQEAFAEIGFDERWLRRVTGASPQNLSMIRVRGDSMVPTLDDDDEILVDRGDVLRDLRDGVYVLRRGESLMVKRLAFSPTHDTVAIRSDNSAYPSWPDVAVEDVQIIGRVVWAGRKVG